MAAALALYSFILLVSFAPSLQLGHRLRLRRMRRTSPHSKEGDVRTVWGRISALRQIRSPVDKLDCVVAWTVVDGRTVRGRRVRVEHATAEDFLLVSKEGLFVVRTDGIQMKETCPTTVPPRTRPEGDLAGALERAELDLGAPATFCESTLSDGDWIGVTGEWRFEPAPQGMALGGYRDAPALPTLRASRGKLRVERLVHLGEQFPRFAESQ